MDASTGNGWALVVLEWIMRTLLVPNGASLPREPETREKVYFDRMLGVVNGAQLMLSFLVGPAKSIAAMSLWALRPVVMHSLVFIPVGSPGVIGVPELTVDEVFGPNENLPPVRHYAFPGVRVECIPESAGLWRNVLGHPVPISREERERNRNATDGSEEGQNSGLQGLANLETPTKRRRDFSD